MSVFVMKRRFESPPSKDEILDLASDTTLGDRAKVRDALTHLLAPLKDILALLQFVDNVDKTAENLADMAAAVKGLENDLADLKSKTASAKKANDAQVDRGKKLVDEISSLEETKATLSKEIIDEKTTRINMSEALAMEYENLRDKMLRQVAAEEKTAKEATEKRLNILNTAVTQAEKKLAVMEEKKRQFIASLGG